MDRLRQLWRAHEEGLLYALAAIVYISAGVMVKAIVLNWIVGILFPVVVVSAIPSMIRRRASARGTSR